MLRIAAVLFVMTFASAGTLHSIVPHTHSDISTVSGELGDGAHCHRGDNTVSESLVWSFVHCSLAHNEKKSLAIVSGQFALVYIAPVQVRGLSLFLSLPRTQPDALEKHLSSGKEQYRMFG